MSAASVVARSAPSTDDPTSLPPIPPLRRDRRVQVWLGASAVSWVGDQVFTIAFAWTAVHLASPAVAGLLVGVEMVPRALLLLLGGALADRLPTRPTLLACAVLRSVVLLLAVAGWEAGVHRLPLLFAVALLFGAVQALDQPATMTLPRQLVRPEDLGRVAGLSQVTRRLSVFVGAGLGGLLAATAGLPAAMLVDAVSFAVVAVVFAVWVRPRRARPPADDVSVLDGLREGLRYVARDRVARRLVVGLSGLNLFIGPVTAVGVPLRVATSGWSAGWVGAVEAAIGIGAALGAVGAMRRSGHEHDAVRGFGLLVVQGLALVALGSPTPVAVLVGAAVVGLTAGSASVLLGGIFQRTIEAAYLGRAASLQSLSDYALLPAMMPLFGWVAHTSGVATATAVFGVGMMLLSAWGALGSRRSLRT